LPRCVGGAVGCAGSDVVRSVERLPATTEDDLLLPELCMLLVQSLLVFDNVAQTIRVMSHAHLGDGVSPDEAYDAAVARIDELVDRLSDPPLAPVAEPAAPGELRANLTPEAYHRTGARATDDVR